MSIGWRKLTALFPEAETAISQHGRADDCTDAGGFCNAELFVPLKPADQWPNEIGKQRLTEQMISALAAQFPVVELNFSPYIQDNVEEAAASEVKGENSNKLAATSYVALLIAEQSYQQMLNSLVQAQANRYIDTVALVQALGDVWWHRNSVAAVWMELPPVPWIINCLDLKLGPNPRQVGFFGW